MLQTVINLIDAERTVHMQVHDGLVDVLLAALSAEPATIGELRAALTRFVAASVADRVFEQAEEGLAPLAAEGGQVIVDLSARLVVNDTPLPEIPRIGIVLSCDEHTTLEDWLPYRIPDEWDISCERSQWQQRARLRREALAHQPPIDSRSVLYGHLASQLVQYWQKNLTVEEDPVAATQREWLLTPRADLGGQTPRAVLLAHRKFIDGDVEDQGQTWMITGQCPPALPATSQAYRLGGFGSHEIILYHELTAHLLMYCERRIVPGKPVDIAYETRQLEQLQQEWLHQPQETLYNQSPAAMIARERSRLPAVVPQGHSSEHDDCPICRMMFASGQPMIWTLDNFMLDRCFATSFFTTHQEWEAAQQEWEDLNCEGEPWRGETEWRGETVPIHSESTEGARIWQRSHTNMEFFEQMAPLEACNVMLFSIGGHLGELILDIKAFGIPYEKVEQLHERFDELRVALQEREEVWMLQQAIGSLSDLLHELSTTCTEVQAKCGDLAEKLEFLCRRYQEHFDQDQEAAL